MQTYNDIDIVVWNKNELFRVEQLVADQYHDKYRSLEVYHINLQITF